MPVATPSFRFTLYKPDQLPVEFTHQHGTTTIWARGPEGYRVPAVAGIIEPCAYNATGWNVRVGPPDDQRSSGMNAICQNLDEAIELCDQEIRRAYRDMNKGCRNEHQDPKYTSHQAELAARFEKE